ncbi:putative acetyltransferase [Xanthomonas citri pv. citri]|nr:putative acetyltransferase [Xanthomonas citri pv. citri]AJZ47721.1 putative acetyltransferase [Xanthomonas citri pv. citri]AJZ52340.1 putative acetyltransferase [Xanthomonas citri pv. citri]AJZ65135.1 putative acetyltransferase [Xanthomonas citri pv. citri]CEE59594.1 hypothetical protein XAC3608_160044 [Xanthomonas citri pv. citri]
MSRPAPQIRSATPADVPLLHELITALAVYEREPDAVKASLEDVRASLFDDGATAHALICEQDGQALGFAVYFFNYSTWLGRNGLYLEDLFVRPEARGKGAARARALRCCGTWRSWPCSVAAGGSNGRCWTGTSRPSTSTRQSERARWTAGPCTGSTASGWPRLLRAAEPGAPGRQDHAKERPLPRKRPSRKLEADPASARRPCYGLLLSGLSMTPQ